jgi:hypothetical protein
VTKYSYPDFRKRNARGTQASETILNQQNQKWKESKELLTVKLEK